MVAEHRIVEVEVPPDEVDLAADALWRLGASAVAESGLPDGRVRLLADVPDPSGLPGRWPWRLLAPDLDADLDAWRAFARPVQVGRVVVRPAWLPPEPRGARDLVVAIDPGRAFGSGSHPATQLAVRAMDATLEPGDRVLDVGCGSGVLSVVAALLGAASVVAVDMDQAAVAATAANAARNGVGGRVDASATPLAQVDGAFDLVVANIGVRVLTDEAEPLEARLAPAGHLVLSGLLLAQEEAVVAAYPRCERVARFEQEGWVAPVLRRRPG